MTSPQVTATVATRCRGAAERLNVLRPCCVPANLTNCSATRPIKVLGSLAPLFRGKLGTTHSYPQPECGCVSKPSPRVPTLPPVSFQEPKEPAPNSCKASSKEATMSLATSIPSIKVKVGGVSVSPPHRACRSFAVIRSSKAEGPIRRPAAPPLSPPPPMPPKTPALSTPPTLSQPPTPVKPTAPTSLSSSPPPEPKPVEAAASAAVQKPVAGAVTLEYQRKVAKELQDYFKQKKLEEADQGPFFGFLPKNEISNGRWAMFGFAVGMLTEYATGSDFVQQMKILLSNFGIVDLD
ncbi:light-harvesting complex-like protein OHP2, chloroplastic [Phragmites australis]|uniref:light-harvesting complex-like protein OHP2, chloroplastic n=1 Tax=Phragmites australis TaxID=29695 RepID=UPI002D79F915|nr:light-harvesting complex-like protein OHP2, chloroplastic [Phragmites australis]